MSIETASHCEITVYLAVESAVLEPSMLTEKLGVIPDRCWSAGESRGKTGKFWDVHGWVIEVRVRSGDDERVSASQLLRAALDAFGKRIAPLVTGLRQLSASAERYVVASVICDIVPGIELNPPFLKLLSELGASFQIDIQC